jgi:DNA-binding response OmpR family regulator
VERRLKVYAPAPKLRERSLRGELEQARGRVESLLAEIDAVAEAGPDGEGWRDVAIATGIGLRALTTAAAAVPERQPLALASTVFEIGGLRIDTTAHRQWYGGTEVVLTPLHHQVLATMAGDPQRAFVKDELFQMVWGKQLNGGRSNAVNQAVCRIRNALVAAGAPREEFLVASRRGWVLRRDDGGGRNG